MNHAFDHEFTELLPPDPRADECTKFLLDGRVHGFVCIPLMEEVGVQPGVPRLVE